MADDQSEVERCLLWSISASAKPQRHKIWKSNRVRRNDQRSQPTTWTDQTNTLLISSSLFCLLLSHSFIRPTAAGVHLRFTPSAEQLTQSRECDECLNFLTLSYLHPASTSRSQTRVKFTHERLNTRVTQQSHLHTGSLRHDRIGFLTHTGHTEVKRSTSEEPSLRVRVESRPTAQKFNWKRLNNQTRIGWGGVGSST